MITFENFKIEDGSPIYTQIIRHIQSGIVAGTIINQDEMPSRRVLSALLGVNPNTIQKAYKLLEEEQIIESRSGAKSYITIDEEKISKIRSTLVQNDIQTLINNMKQMSISKDDAIKLIENSWSTEQNKEED